MAEFSLPGQKLELEEEERVVYRLLSFRVGACLLMAAAILSFGVVDRAAAVPVFDDEGSWVEYSHDVDSDVEGLEDTTGSDNPNYTGIGGPPGGGDPLPHATSEDPAGPPSSTATGGIYHTEGPGVATLQLWPGTGLGQTDPPGGTDIGPSTFRTDFQAIWDIHDTPLYVFPFMNFFVTGNVGAGGFVGFDAEWQF